MKTQDNLLHRKVGVLQVMKLKNKLCLQLLYFMPTFTYTPQKNVWISRIDPHVFLVKIPDLFLFLIIIYHIQSYIGYTTEGKTLDGCLTF